jgi:(p)ppGpp synthase/HD superfamily hydrolase
MNGDAMITAHEAARSSTAGASRYSFGIDATNTAAALRRLADAIDRGEITIESVRVQSLATADDFTSTLLRLKVHELKPNG